jgi:cytochrome P450
LTDPLPRLGTRIVGHANNEQEALSVVIDARGRGSLSSDVLDRHARLYADTTRPLADLVHIEDPAFYADPWRTYARLQDEAPVYYYEPFNTWVLTKHDDVKAASRHADQYSVEAGILLYDGVRPGAGIGELFAGAGDIIGLTDPPRHGELRRIMQTPFTPPSLARLQPHIERHCDRMLDLVVPGEPLDWAAVVASRLPTLVIAAILGIPDDDEKFFERVREWTDATENIASRDLSEAELAETIAAFGGLNSFIADVFDEKRRCPAEDFLTSLLNDHLDNQNLSETNLVGFAQLLISAGADTSRSLLSELVAHLAMFPEQLDVLRSDRSFVPNAIEETLRYAPAARGFGRQVAEDTTLRGRKLEAGQRVWMAYDAANRDPEVFEDPHRFDVRRSNSRSNVAFGFGAHVCIAAPLVRLETKILLDKLIERFPRFEIAGTGHRVESFLRNGWIDLPMVFYPA